MRFAMLDNAGMIAAALALQLATPSIVPGSDPELWPVRVATSVGYIDAAGTMVLRPRWSDGAPFIAGRGAVKDRRGWFFIDRAGEPVIPGPFDDVRSFSEGFAAVKSKGAWFFIDAQGRPQGNPEFMELHDVKDGIAVAKRNSAPKNPEPEYIWVTPNGQLALPVKAPGCAGFVAPVRYREHLRGRNAPALLVRCGRQEESFTRRAGDRPDAWGYLSRDGKRFIVAPTLGLSMPFSDGVAAAVDRGGWRFIDGTGATAIPPGFGDVVLSFNRGLALVSRGQGKAKALFAIGPDGKDRLALPPVADPGDALPLWQGVLRFGEGFLLTVAEPFPDLAAILIGSGGQERARFPGYAALQAQGKLAELMPFDREIVGGKLPSVVRLYVDTDGKIVYRLTR